MRPHASDETKEDELDKLEEDMRGGKGEVSLINENIDTSNSISSFSSDTSSDCEQIEQAPLETVYVDVCVDSLMMVASSSSNFSTSRSRLPRFLSSSLHFWMLSVKSTHNCRTKARRLRESCLVQVRRSHRRSRHGLEHRLFRRWRIHLGCPRFADLLNAAKSK